MARLNRFSFRATVILLVVVSFVVLIVRGRPLGRDGDVVPLLFASGLHQPRGLVFSSQGELFVAEAGYSRPGTATVSGRISRIGPAGVPEVLVDGLGAASPLQPMFAQGGPVAITSLIPPPFDRFTVFTGPGAPMPLGAVAILGRVDGRWQVDHTTAVPAALAGNTPGFAAVSGAALGRDGALYAVLPLANQMVRVAENPPGSAVFVTQAITSFVGPGQRNPYPVGVAAAPDGSLYVAHFGTEPFRAGGGRIVRVELDGRWSPVYEGLTFPMAIAVGPAGQLYVLEYASGYDATSGRFRPRTGRLLLVDPARSRQRTIAGSINFPTALAFSPEGDIYLTETEINDPAGDGRVLRVVAQMLPRTT